MNRLSLFILCLTLIFVSCQNKNGSVDVSEELETSDTIMESEIEESSEDERQYWQKPEIVIRDLGNLSDKTVCDLGAGIGYFAFKLLPDANRVIAIDVDTMKINILNQFRANLPDNLRTKLDVRLAESQDPHLSDNETDIILIVNTIAYINNRVNYFKNLKSKIRPGGQIVIVDFKTRIIPEYVNAPPYNEREYVHVIEEELLSAGYSIDRTNDTSLEYQYMVFARPGS